MKKLSVICDSLRNKVVYKHGRSVLCTLKWGLKENDIPGFFVESSECLVDIYDKEFYKLDDAALSGFIVNMAHKIKFDQQMDEVDYIDNTGDSISLPVFLPSDIQDADIDELPGYQIGVCNAWVAFNKEFNSNLHVEFLQYLGQQGLMEGFIDLVNVELSLLMKGQEK